MENSSRIVKLLLILVFNVLAFENADYIINASNMYHQSSTYSGHLFVNIFSAFCVNLVFFFGLILGAGFNGIRTIILVLQYILAASIMNRISANPHFWNKSTFIYTSLNFFMWYGIVAFFIVYFSKDFLRNRSQS
jgi:hypothetical protein